MIPVANLRAGAHVDLDQAEVTADPQVRGRHVVGQRSHAILGQDA